MPLRKLFPNITGRQEWYGLLFAVMFIAAIFLSVLFTYWQVDVSQHHWCVLLQTLTQHPVPKPSHPAVNPSRQQAYLFYRELTDLRGEFGCD